MTSVLEIDGLKHTLYNPSNKNDTFTVNVDGQISIDAGTFTSILGESGCGKTTLLTVIGLLRKPAEVGTFRINDEDIAGLWKWKRNRRIEELRRRSIGFALQSGEPLPALTVAENIAVPLRLNGKQAKERVNELLTVFRLFDEEKNESLANRRVASLSGGQLQRVILARAIAHSPEIVFVDEPTSALDKTRAREALDVLKELKEKENTAIVMITHDRDFAALYSDKIIEMEPGQVKGTGRIKEVCTGETFRQRIPNAGNKM